MADDTDPTRPLPVVDAAPPPRPRSTAAPRSQLLTPNDVHLLEESLSAKPTAGASSRRRRSSDLHVLTAISDDDASMASSASSTACSSPAPPCDEPPGITVPALSLGALLTAGHIAGTSPAPCDVCCSCGNPTSTSTSTSTASTNSTDSTRTLLCTCRDGVPCSSTTSSTPVPWNVPLILSPKSAQRLKQTLGLSDDELVAALHEAQVVQLDSAREQQNAKLLRLQRSTSKAHQVLGIERQQEKLKDHLGVSGEELSEAMRESERARLAAEEAQIETQRRREDDRLLQRQRDSNKALRLLGLHQQSASKIMGRLGISDDQLHAALDQALVLQHEAIERQSSQLREQEDAVLLMRNSTASKALRRLGVTQHCLSDAATVVEAVRDAHHRRRRELDEADDDYSDDRLAFGPDTSASATSEDNIGEYSEPEAGTDLDAEEVAELLAHLPPELLYEMAAAQDAAPATTTTTTSSSSSSTQRR